MRYCGEVKGHIATISDVWPALTVYLWWPGDTVVGWLVQNRPSIARFLELSQSSCGGWFSIGISVSAYAVALFAVAFVFAVAEVTFERITNRGNGRA